MSLRGRENSRARIIRGSTTGAIGRDRERRKYARSAGAYGRLSGEVGGEPGWHFISRINFQLLDIFQGRTTREPAVFSNCELM